MDPQARSRLASAARRYLAAAPWRVIAGGYLFGLHDRTGGRFGCASVMGQAGSQFGLDVSFDAQGFSLHRKLHDRELDVSSYQAKANSVSISITDLSASRAPGTFERFVVDREKVTAPRSGHLTGFRLVAGREPRPLDSDEAVFLARCLEAVAELAETGRLGSDAPRDGGRTLFFNLADDGGKLSIRSSYRRVDEVDVFPEKITLPAAFLARLKGLPRIDGRYIASIFTPPTTIRDELFWMALVLDDTTKRLIVADAAPTFGDAALGLFLAFSGETKRGARVGVPREVWVDSFPAFEAMKDAMLELQVRFVSKGAIPEMEHVKGSLGEYLRRA